MPSALERQREPNAQQSTGSGNATVTATIATATAEPKRNYKGFVAGVFSGIAKLSVGHP